MISSSSISSNSQCGTNSHEDSQMQNMTAHNELDLQEQVMANLEKPNIPNVNVPERIIICLDICCDNNSLFHLADGTSFTPMNMLKRVLDFFIHSKLAINKKTKFAIVFLEKEPVWVLDFTSNVKNIFTVIDFVTAEENTAESFDFKGLFRLLKEKVEVPEYKQGESVLVPPYVVRLLLLYARSDCVPFIPQDDPYFLFLKKQPYFNIDILYAHENDCASYKCVEIFDSLQYLDNGYSYVYEVSRNAAKIHDCTAKLLAHPLQRVLQKHTNYSFSTRP